MRYKFGYSAAAAAAAAADDDDDVLHREWLASLSEGACRNH